MVQSAENGRGTYSLFGSHTLRYYQLHKAGGFAIVGGAEIMVTKEEDYEGQRDAVRGNNRMPAFCLYVSCNTMLLLCGFARGGQHFI